MLSAIHWLPRNFGEAVEQVGSFSVSNIASGDRLINVLHVGVPARRKRCAHQARTGFSAALPAGSVRGFAGLDRVRRAVKLLTCLEMAKQAKEVPAVTNRRAERQDFLPGGLL
jgi:hypothetical protein